MAKAQFSIRLEPELLDRIDAEIAREHKAFKKQTGIGVQITRVAFIRDAIETVVTAREKRKAS